MILRSSDRKNKSVVTASPKNRKRRTINKYHEDSEELSEEDTTTEERFDFTSLSTTEICMNVVQWANELESLRSKCRNLKGTISGSWRTNNTKIRTAGDTLLERIGHMNDPTYLRMRNNELSLSLKSAEKEIARLKSDNKELLARGKEHGSIATVSNSQPLKIAQTASTSSSKTNTFKATSAFSGVKSHSSPANVVNDVYTKNVIDDQDDFCISQSPALEVSSLRTVLVQEFQKQMGEYYKIRNDMNLKLEKMQNLITMASEDATSKSVSPLEVPLPQRTRTKPKILSDIQIVPPHDRAGPSTALDKSHSETNLWTTVVGRGNKKKKLLEEKRANITVDREENSKQNLTFVRRNTPKRKPPRTAAVTITGTSSDFSYASALKIARENISLRELGIESTKIRKTMNGGVLIEISGPGGNDKADKLASQLKNFITDANVGRPIRKAELRIIGMDDSASIEELTSILVEVGGCSAESIRVSDIRTMTNGLGMAWAQLPLTAALKVSHLGKIRVGWTNARVELLKAKPVQCYKCWHYGHLRYACSSKIDRTGNCFRCGRSGHNAPNCNFPIRCVLCDSEGLPNSHRIGSRVCKFAGDNISPDRRPDVNLSSK